MMLIFELVNTFGEHLEFITKNTKECTKKGKLSLFLSWRLPLTWRVDLGRVVDILVSF